MSGRTKRSGGKRAPHRRSGASGTSAAQPPAQRVAAPPSARVATMPPSFRALYPVLIVVAGVLAYMNSFSGVFLLDDVHHILVEERIRTLWPPTEWLGSRRPLVALSLAINYAIDGFNPRGYHVLNLLVHLLAGMTLYGIVRRTATRVGSSAGGAAWFGLIVALLWTVHPLQTQSVTYVIQRGESMMGLAYLLTLYCVIRGVSSTRSRLWFAGAVLACAAGMGCKAVMVTAPVMVLLYDRVFLSDSFAALLRRRWVLYGALAATWSVLVLVGVVRGVLAPPANARASVGFGIDGLTPAQYLFSQGGVILHYLRLSFWPTPLCLDYRWPPVQGLSAALLPDLLVVVLFTVGAAALRFRPWLGFVAAWFFVILAPTSSFIPVADIAFEHRMYLSLVSAIVIGVVVTHRLLSWLTKGRVAPSRLFAVEAALAGMVVIAMAWGTFDRNRDYHSAIGMWTNVIDQRPLSARAHTHLGQAHLDAGNADRALELFGRATQLEGSFYFAYNGLGNAYRKKKDFVKAAQAYETGLGHEPDRAEMHNNLAIALVEMKRYDEAIEHYHEARRLKPELEQVSYNLALAYEKQGDFDSAIATYDELLEQYPGDPLVQINQARVHARRGNIDQAIAMFDDLLAREPKSGYIQYSLGNMLAEVGRGDEAIASYRRALELEPELHEARVDLAGALMKRGDTEQAIALFRETVRNRPESAEAHHHLGMALGDRGAIDEAREALERARSLRPNWAPPVYSQGKMLAERGRIDEGVELLEEALVLDPTLADAHNELGVARTRQRRRAEAVAHFEQALAIDPQHVDALTNMGVALAQAGDTAGAMSHFRRALEAEPDHAEAHSNMAIVLAQQNKRDEAIEHFLEALRINPRYADAHGNLAMTYEQQGNLVDARTHMSEAVRLRPNVAELHYRFGLMLQRMNDPGAADDAFRSALRLNPNHAAARAALAGQE